MKKNARSLMGRIISILLAVCLTVCCVPVRAFAWKNLTHVTSANLILLEMLRSSGGQITIHAPYGSDEAYTYTVPAEYQEALKEYPEAFRAGAMGPDFYPDMLTGQGYIHPYGKDPETRPGAWITLLCNSVNMMPKDSEERKRALSFTLGFMFHYCGDIFAHDFVNQFAGGTFPSVTDALSSNRDLNIMLSHMSEETYVDALVNWDFYNKCDMLNIDAPIEFISDTMLYDGAKNNGSADIYKDYGSVPAIYVYLIDLRAYLYEKAEEMRTSVDPARSAVVMYLDAWIDDLDKAVDALVRCFNSMANKMVTVKDPDMVSIITGEITAWFDEYGRYITPLPDSVADLAADGAKELFNQVISGFHFAEDTDKMKSEQVRSLALTHIGIPGLDEKIKEFTDRMNDPEIQLDYPSNPFSPRDKEEGGNFKEFAALVSGFADEGTGFNNISYSDIMNGTDGGALDKALDSDLDAFYNALVMFKLILIGPDNFSNFIRRVSNVEQTQYQKNTAELSATSLAFEIKTADTPYAGTDDNIFAVVYDMEKSGTTPIIKKLLDSAGKNDFENSVESTYIVELGDAVKLSNIEVEIRQESTGTAAPEWDCESISITPYHAGAALTRPIGFGGRYGMKDGDVWKLCFHDELMLRTQIAEKWNTLGALSAKAEIETDSVLFSGTDDSVELEIYNGSDLVKSIPLDKYDYNDFEAGCKDTYPVPLADNLEEAIPLEDLNMKLRSSASTVGDEWAVRSVSVTLYHGELQLKDTVVRGPEKLNNSTWDLNITGDLSRKACSATPITLSYETNVDDGMLDFVYSLDGSHQYVNSNGLLWGDAAVRKEVFFKIFKGFCPDIEYVGEKKEISEGQAFHMDFTLEGKWNGTGQNRRDQVSFNPDTTPGNSDDHPEMPAVRGTARISFVNSAGETVCFVDQPAEGGKIQLRSYKNNSLTAGTYTVAVHYDPGSDPMYAASDGMFEDKLTVTAAVGTPAVITKAPKPKTGLVFNGTAQALVEPGEAENGTMVYAVVKDGDPEPAAELYTASIPTAADAGTYDVWYKAKANGEGADAIGDAIGVTIGKGIKTAPDESLFTVKNETIRGKRDGRISGLTDAMEYGYREEDGAYSGSFTRCTDPAIDNAKAGYYFIRYRETANELASDAVKLQVQAGDAATITIEVVDANGNKPSGEVNLTATDEKGQKYSLDSGERVVKIDNENLLQYTMSGLDYGFYNVEARHTLSGGTAKTSTVLIETADSDITGRIVALDAGDNESKAAVSALDELSDTGVGSIVLVGGLEQEAKNLGRKGVENAVITMDIRSGGTEASDLTIGETDTDAEKEVKTEKKEILERAREAYGDTSSAAPANTKAAFLEIGIEQTDSSQNKTRLTETSGVLELLIPYQFSGKYDIRLWRSHQNGADARETMQLESLSERPSADGFKDGTCFLDKENGRIFVYSKLYSAYAVTYSTEEAYVVTFDPAGGTAVDAQRVTRNANGKFVAEAPFPVPTKSGHIFAGWYAGELAWDFSDEVSANMTLTAHWLEDPVLEGFQISFAEDAGDPYKGLTYNSKTERYEIVYTGSAITPAVIVKGAGAKALTEGVDYTVRYSGNKAVSGKKSASVIVTGKGNLTGQKTLSFTILPVDLNEAKKNGTLVIPDELKVQSGRKLSPALFYNGVQLKKSEYELGNTEDKEVEITGKGSFTGTLTGVKVHVLTKDEVKAATIQVTLKAGQHVYNGEAQTLTDEELSVKAGTKTLNPDTDYTVVYLNNLEAGTAKAVVIAKGAYLGTATKTFRIQPDKTTKITAEITAKLSDPNAHIYYDAKGAAPAVTVSVDRAGKTVTLRPGVDYKVSFSNNKKAGTASYTVSFIGSYKGQAAIRNPFEIEPAPFKDAVVAAPDMVYKNPGAYRSTPFVSIGGVVLKKQDYTVRYFDGGTALGAKDKIILSEGETARKITIQITGSGKNYEAATVSGSYYVTAPLSSSVNLSGTRIVAKGTTKAVAAQDYTGEKLKPEIDVLLKSGGEWVPLDVSSYQAVYLNNVEKGRATILVTGAAGAEADGTRAVVGSKTANFTIKAGSIKDYSGESH